MLASVILTRAVDIIQDATNVRWPEAELLRWLSDGQREVVIHKPEANVTNTSLQLAAGNTKQSLPAAGLQLIDVVRNLGSNGTTPGRAVRLVAREVLDAQRPDWHTEAGASAVKHFVFDARDPRTFYVYPQPLSAFYLEVIYSVAPADLTAGSSVLTLSDIYANALLDYVLYRAYSKDAEYAGNANRAVAHYSAFANSIGIKTANDRSRGPSANSPMNPNYPATPGNLP